MAIIDKQDVHRNRSISRSRLVRGELTFGDDAPVAGNQYVVTAIPAGSAISRVVGISYGAGDVDLTVTIDGTDYTLTAKETEMGLADLGNKIFAEGKQVLVAVGANMTKGSVVLAVEYFDLMNITGETVRRVEA